MTQYPQRNARVCAWSTLFLSVILAGTDCQVRADQHGLAVTDLKRDSAVDFEDEVMPLLRQNCLACHNATDAESDLILEDPETILAGGIEGPAVVAGQAAESLLFNVSAHRVDPVMPPEDNDVGAENFTADELGLLKLWIDQGARGQLKEAAPRIQWQPVPTQVLPVYAVAVSPDGSYVAATRANQVSVYHLATQKEVTRLTDPAVVSAARPGSPQAAHFDLVQSLAFSPDGQRLASGGFRTVKLWRRVWPTQSLKLDVDLAKVTAVARTGNATRVAVGTTDGRIVVIDGSSGRVFKTLDADGNTIRSLAFSHDDTRLACGADNSVIRVYDVVAGSERGRISTEKVPHAVAWVANDSQIAAAGADHAIRLWPAPTLDGLEKAVDPQARLEGHDAAVTTLAGLSDKRQLVSGSRDGTLRIWNVQSGRLLHRMDHGAPITGAAVRRDGLRIVSIGENGVAKLWDASNGQLKSDLRGNLRERRHGIELLHALEREKLHVANVESDLDAAAKRKADEDDNVKQAEEELKKAEMNDAKRNAEAARRLVQRDRDAAQKAAKAVPLLEVSLRQAEEKLKARQHEYSQQQQAASTAGATPTSIGFSIDGSEVAVASDDGGIHTFDGDDGSPIEALASSPCRVVAMAYLSGGRLLTATRGATLILRDTLPRWQLEKSIGSPDSSNELAGRVTALDFSPDGKLLATGAGEVSRSGQLKLWDVSEGRIVREMEKAHEDTVLGIAFSPDGKQIASCGSDRLMKVFHVDSGSLQRVFEGHTHHVLGVSWQADSRQLATCSADREIKIWDARTGNQQRTITGFAKEITAIRFMGLAQRVVVSTGNDLITSRKVDGGGGLKFSGVSAFMYTVDCTADGKIVVAGGHDGIVRVWSDQGKPIVTFMPPSASSASGRSATN